MDSQEAKPYKNDPEIIALTNLVNAYMRHEIKTFEKLLKGDARSVMADPFIRAYIEDLLKNSTHLPASPRISPHLHASPRISTHLPASPCISPHLHVSPRISVLHPSSCVFAPRPRLLVRTQVLLKVITPYTRISIAFIATELNIPPADVEHLLVALILDGQVRHLGRSPAPSVASSRLLSPPRASSRLLTPSLALSRPLSPSLALSHPLSPSLALSHTSLCLLICDGQVDGQIDQIGQLLLLRQTSADAKKYAAAEKWATQLGALQQTILTKLA